MIIIIVTHMRPATVHRGSSYSSTCFTISNGFPIGKQILLRSYQYYHEYRKSSDLQQHLLTTLLLLLLACCRSRRVVRVRELDWHEERQDIDKRTNDRSDAMYGGSCRTTSSFPYYIV